MEVIQLTEQQLISLMKQMSLEEKIAQLLQLATPFFEGAKSEGRITGPMASMGITENMVHNTGSILGLTGAEEVISLCCRPGAGLLQLFQHRSSAGRPDAQVRYVSQYLDIPNEPLLPFGFGLSYTSFSYGEISLSEFAVYVGPNSRDVQELRFTLMK